MINVRSKRKKAIDQLRQCRPVDLAVFTPKEAKSILDEVEAEILSNLDKIERLIGQKTLLENSLVSISEVRSKLVKR